MTDKFSSILEQVAQFYFAPTSPQAAAPSDAKIIHQCGRDSQRRGFYIDVGHMDQTVVDAKLREIIHRYKVR